MPRPALIVRKLRRARRMADKSVAKLARDSGLATSFISWIESGRFIPTEEQLRRLANAIGFPPERDVWVLFETDPTPDDVPPVRKHL